MYRQKSSNMSNFTFFYIKSKVAYLRQMCVYRAFYARPRPRATNYQLICNVFHGILVSLRHIIIIVSVD